VVFSVLNYFSSKLIKRQKTQGVIILTFRKTLSPMFFLLDEKEPKNQGKIMLQPALENYRNNIKVTPIFIGGNDKRL
jgi:hypothetical protein